MTTRRTQVAIIGAGPSGLAVGAVLRSSGVPFEIIEREETVGSSWRNHYARLHLHTVKQHSSLPYMPFPAHIPTYPSRAEVVEYLDGYARRFDLQPNLGETVQTARWEDGRWHLQSDVAETIADSLVVATGYNGEPNVPDWPERECYTGEVLHSHDYFDGRDYRGKTVLLVGIGNSGGEIAIDLFEFGARVTMAVRSPIHVIPRDLFGIPAQMTSLLMSHLPAGWADKIAGPLIKRSVGDLSAYGLTRPDIGPVEQVNTEGRIPLLDIGTIDLIKQGAIRVVPSGIKQWTETGVEFENGEVGAFDVVLLATGYKPRLDRFLEEAESLTDDRGYPKCHGAEGGGRNLYFIGYRNPITGALRDIADQARAIGTKLHAERVTQG